MRIEFTYSRGPDYFRAHLAPTGRRAGLTEVYGGVPAIVAGLRILRGVGGESRFAGRFAECVFIQDRDLAAAARNVADLRAPGRRCRRRWRFRWRSGWSTCPRSCPRARRSASARSGPASRCSGPITTCR